MNRLLIFVLAVSIHISVRAQAWELKTNKDGIKVYSAHTDNSKFKSVKAECTVKATPAQVLAVLTDINKYSQWVYHAKSVKLLKKVSDHEYIYYSEVQAPFPVTNRDYIAHLKIISASSDITLIKSEAMPQYVHKKKDLVRILSSNAEWKLTALGSNQTKIDYVLHFDPAGSVPAWITNMFVTEGPYQSFKNLKAHVTKP
jgi:ribosome-associated toxin RatA of RatAB toxin-antitoxin module